MSVTACQGKAAVCQGLKVLSPDILAPQRDPYLYRHPGYCAEGIPLLQVLCRRSYRTYRSSGLGYRTLTELTEVPGILWHGRTELIEVPGRYKNVVPVPRYYETGRTELTEVPGSGMEVVHNLQNFRVRV